MSWTTIEQDGKARELTVDYQKVTWVCGLTVLVEKCAQYEKVSEHLIIELLDGKKNSASDKWIERGRHCSHVTW